MSEKQLTDREILIKIHDQLVELKSLIAEIEIGKSGTGASFAQRIRRATGDTKKLGG
jgi:hypothetical protein